MEISSPEHDEIHRLLAEIVVFVEIVFNNVPQLFEISYFNIVLGIGLGIAEVAEHQTAEVVFGYDAVTVAVEVDKQTIEVFTKTRLGDFFDV
jgi:hypothetical protein